MSQGARFWYEGLSFPLVVFPLIGPALLAAVNIVAWSFGELVLTFFISSGDQTLPCASGACSAVASTLQQTTWPASFWACTLLAGQFISGRETAR
jgi:ABC-type spermidine/putrescine transport system permease subunit II